MECRESSKKGIDAKKKVGGDLIPVIPMGEIAPHVPG